MPGPMIGVSAVLAAIGTVTAVSCRIAAGGPNGRGRQGSSKRGAKGSKCEPNSPVSSSGQASNVAAWLQKNSSSSLASTVGQRRSGEAPAREAAPQQLLRFDLHERLVALVSSPNGEVLNAMMMSKQPLLRKSLLPSGSTENAVIPLDTSSLFKVEVVRDRGAGRGERELYMFRSLAADGRLLEADPGAQLKVKLGGKGACKAALWRTTPSGGLTNERFSGQALPFHVKTTHTLDDACLPALRQRHAAAMHDLRKELDVEVCVSAKAQRRVEDLIAASRDMQRAHTQQVAGLNQQLDEYMRGRACAERDAEGLRLQLHEARLALRGREEQLTQAKAEARKASQRLEALVAGLQEQVAAQARSAAAEAERTAREGARQAESIRALRQQVLDHQTALEGQCMELDARDARIAALEEQNDKLDTVLKVLGQQLAVAGSGGVGGGGELASDEDEVDEGTDVGVGVEDAGSVADAGSEAGGSGEGDNDEGEDEDDVHGCSHGAADDDSLSCTGPAEFQLTAVGGGGASDAILSRSRELQLQQRQRQRGSLGGGQQRQAHHHGQNQKQHDQAAHHNQRQHRYHHQRDLSEGELRPAWAAALENDGEISLAALKQSLRGSRASTGGGFQLPAARNSTSNAAGRRSVACDDASQRQRLGLGPPGMGMGGMGQQGRMAASHSIFIESGSGSGSGSGYSGDAAPQQLLQLQHHLPYDEEEQQHGQGQGQGVGGQEQEQGQERDDGNEQSLMMPVHGQLEVEESEGSVGSICVAAGAEGDEEEGEEEVQGEECVEGEEEGEGEGSTSVTPGPSTSSSRQGGSSGGSAAEDAAYSASRGGRHPSHPRPASNMLLLSSAAPATAAAAAANDDGDGEAPSVCTVAPAAPSTTIGASAAAPATAGRASVKKGVGASAELHNIRQRMRRLGMEAAAMAASGGLRQVPGSGVAGAEQGAVGDGPAVNSESGSLGSRSSGESVTSTAAVGPGRIPSSRLAGARHRVGAVQQAAAGAAQEAADMPNEAVCAHATPEPATNLAAANAAAPMPMLPMPPLPSGGHTDFSQETTPTSNKFRRLSMGNAGNAQQVLGQGTVKERAAMFVAMAAARLSSSSSGSSGGGAAAAAAAIAASGIPAGTSRAGSRRVSSGGGSVVLASMPALPPPLPLLGCGRVWGPDPSCPPTFPPLQLPSANFNDVDLMGLIDGDAFCQLGSTRLPPTHRGAFPTGRAHKRLNSALSDCAAAAALAVAGATEQAGMSPCLSGLSGLTGDDDCMHSEALPSPPTSMLLGRRLEDLLGQKQVGRMVALRAGEDDERLSMQR